MPREIIKYLCSFKCGTKAKSTLEQANYHEAICFKNPKVQACTTCKHEIYEHEVDVITDPHYMRHEYTVRSCKILTQEQFDELIFMCDYHSKPKFHKQPVTRCKYWEAKQKLSSQTK